ncbi:MAG: hypothetical protein LRZ94_01175 [Candidatus Pacebacteria bacterium]|nr:hypothetical protein [Candidatus Paceibacterota bacterium]
MTMPNVGSWNGKWSGEEDYYATIKHVSKEKAKKILGRESYYYNFGDGWDMNIGVRKVDNKEAAKIRKKTKGFCGYDWAVGSIINYGKIIAGEG